MLRITKAIFGNENSVLTVSAMMKGEYGQNGVFAGVPCIVNRSGVRKILTLNLTDEEMEKFGKSCKLLEDTFKQLNL